VAVPLAEDPFLVKSLRQDKPKSQENLEDSRVKCPRVAVNRAVDRALVRAARHVACRVACRVADRSNHDHIISNFSITGTPLLKLKKLFGYPHHIYTL
jgi:hypothetical protein